MSLAGDLPPIYVSADDLELKPEFDFWAWIAERDALYSLYLVAEMSVWVRIGPGIWIH